MIVKLSNCRILFMYIFIKDTKGNRKRGHIKNRITTILFTARYNFIYLKMSLTIRILNRMFNF